MMKNIIRILIILILMLIVISNYRVEAATFSLKDIFETANNFLNTGSEIVGASDRNKFETGVHDTLKPIAQAILVIGNIVMIIAITYIGIKYFISGADEKAKLKTKLIGILVAAIILYGGREIWAMIIEIFE